MKIIHTQNGIETALIQYIDLKAIRQLQPNGDIPTQVVFAGFVNVTDKNKYDFIPFDDESSVEFIKNCDMIINLDDYKNFTANQLKAEIISLKIKGLLNPTILPIMLYKASSLKALLKLKKHKLSMWLPDFVTI